MITHFSGWAISNSCEWATGEKTGNTCYYRLKSANTWLVSNIDQFHYSKKKCDFKSFP
jgi:hypothetical protein